MTYLAYYLAYFLPQLNRKTCEIPIVFQTEKSRCIPDDAPVFSIYYIKYSLVPAVKSATLLSFQIQ